MPHEFGHHILHLSPACISDALGFQGVGDDELEANLFATFWLLKNDKQRNGGLPQNPESSRTLAIYLFPTLGLRLLRSESLHHGLEVRAGFERGEFGLYRDVRR